MDWLGQHWSEIALVITTVIGWFAGKKSGKKQANSAQK